MKEKKNSAQAVSSPKTRRHSFFAILFSVFVALILWFYVQGAGTSDYRKTFSAVNVFNLSLPEGLSVISGEGVTADITLSGKRSDLNKIKASDIDAYLDLSRVTQAGNYEFDINVMLPDGAAMEECFPKSVQVFIDETSSVAVPVSVELGSFTTEAQTTLEAYPQSAVVTVKGPKTILDEISSAKVVTGDLGNISASFERNLEFTLLDRNGKEVPMTHLVTEQKNVKVNFRLILQKRVPVTVSFKHGFWGEDAVVTVDPETVLIKGEPGLVNSISSICALEIDETTVTSNRATMKVSQEAFLLPDGITFAENFGEAEVKLRVNNNSAKSLRVNLNSSRVVVTPPAGGLTWSFDIDSIDLNLRGKSEFLNAATADDFYLNIDLSSYATAGHHEAKIEIVQTSSTEGMYYAVGEYTIGTTLYQP